MGLLSSISQVARSQLHVNLTWDRRMIRFFSKIVGDREVTLRSPLKTLFFAAIVIHSIVVFCPHHSAQVISEIDVLVAFAMCVYVWDWRRPCLLPLGSQIIDIKVRAAGLLKIHLLFFLFMSYTSQSWLRFQCTAIVYL